MSFLGDPVFLACAAAVLAGAFVQGVGGIGFAMFAAPLVALVRTDLVPGPMIFIGVSLSLLAAAREWRSIDWRGAAYAVAGRVPGSVAAGLVIGLLPLATFSVIFALLVLAAVALSVTGWRVRATPGSLFVAGVGSGVMGTITSVGAPPMGIVMQNMAPATLRATAAVFLVLGGGFSIAVLAWAGRFGRHEFEAGIALLIPMVLGFALSTPFVKRIPGALVRRIVLAVSALSAVVLLVQPR